MISYFLEAVVEFIMTAILTAFIYTGGQPVYMVIAAAIALISTQYIRTGFYNPAFTTMLWFRGDLNVVESVYFAIAQYSGMAAAYLILQYGHMLFNGV
jgi:predicted signal transduction protein with EAL and GGDEF domain